ncbi:STN domain-containing protein [Sphingomonas sp. PAMC 26617]|uniref:STN domain-containing protein n=1 Tax=Sphingomonas sp. PAMC 26617 TaxID=1112216 RepID=UPI0002891343|nr:STN domain-containing protein [Sphingomonas sp. PAMC 26617]
MPRLKTFRMVAGSLLLAAAGDATLLRDAAVAQQAASDRAIAFDIPSLPLDAALDRYFRVTEVQLLYDAALATGRRSSPVRGSYTPREALRRLLAGTGLIPRYTRPNAAILTLPAASPQAAPISLGRIVVRERVAIGRPSPVARLAYYGILETAFEEHLRADRRTSGLAFTVLADLSIDDHGHVVGIRLSKGTGQTRGDRAVAAVLTDTVVPPPPDGLAQPLRLSLRGRTR